MKTFFLILVLAASLGLKALADYYEDLPSVNAQSTVDGRARQRLHDKFGLAADVSPDPEAHPAEYRKLQNEEAEKYLIEIGAISQPADLQQSATAQTGPPPSTKQPVTTHTEETTSREIVQDPSSQNVFHGGGTMGVNGGESEKTFTYYWDDRVSRAKIVNVYLEYDDVQNCNPPEDKPGMDLYLNGATRNNGIAMVFKNHGSGNGITSHQGQFSVLMKGMPAMKGGDHGNRRSLNYNYTIIFHDNTVANQGKATLIHYANPSPASAGGVAVLESFVNAASSSLPERQPTAPSTSSGTHTTVKVPYGVRDANGNYHNVGTATLPTSP